MMGRAMATMCCNPGCLSGRPPVFQGASRNVPCPCISKAGRSAQHIAMKCINARQGLDISAISCQKPARRIRLSGGAELSVRPVRTMPGPARRHFSGTPHTRHRKPVAMPSPAPRSLNATNAHAPVVTRFAPSPTGYLHIGGARTALFNWLYAKAHNGTMRLRIEDTDRTRHSTAAVDAILRDLSWLGIDWSGEPVSQFACSARHVAVARILIEKGAAYRCFASADELAQMRSEARARGLPPRYDGRWRDRDPAEAPPGVAPAIRLKAPQSGVTVIDDAVQGRVTFANDTLDDLVLLRSDGTPTYMLAVVVDDHDMAVTHVIRGDDHLTNAARQRLIGDALGWTMPQMAHIPLIHGADGARLSKRHGALGINVWRDAGILPAAMRNYLARLGWGHGDAEIFTNREMFAWFDISGIGRAPARLDEKKLSHVNGMHMRMQTPDALLADYRSWLAAQADAQGETARRRNWLESPENAGRLRSALPDLQERSRTLAELHEMAFYLCTDRPVEPDARAARLLAGAEATLLAALHDMLQGIGKWEEAQLEAGMRAFCESRDIKLGKLAAPLRAALTGRTVSPGIYAVMAHLGRDESLARIADQRARAPRD